MRTDPSWVHRPCFPHSVRVTPNTACGLRLWPNDLGGDERERLESGLGWGLLATCAATTRLPPPPLRNQPGPRGGKGGKLRAAVVEGGLGNAR